MVKTIKSPSKTPAMAPIAAASMIDSAPAFIFDRTDVVLLPSRENKWYKSGTAVSVKKVFNVWQAVN